MIKVLMKVLMPRRANTPFCTKRGAKGNWRTDPLGLAEPRPAAALCAQHFSSTAGMGCASRIPVLC
eukprot:1161240-Pelagomonas_calceolata.AAC.6